MTAATTIAGDLVVSVLVALLAIAGWTGMQVGLRLLEHTGNDVYSKDSFRRRDMLWLLREALQVAERIPRLSGQAMSVRSPDARVHR